MYLCVYVCMYFFIKHAPVQWSNTTCCNYSCYWFSFVYRGCSDQPQPLHSLYNLKQYTARINPVHLGWHLFSFYIYMRFPYYSSSKSIDFVNVRNGFKCFFISSWWLAGQFPRFRTFLLRWSL